MATVESTITPLIVIGNIYELTIPLVFYCCAFMNTWLPTVPTDNFSKYNNVFQCFPISMVGSGRFKLVACLV